MADYPWPEDFWPNQLRACLGVAKAKAEGRRRVVLTSPTGTGKSRIMSTLIEWAQSFMEPSALYTHRRMLFRQISEVLTRDGVTHGLRASGCKLALLRDVQLIMTQSEASAVLRRQSRDLHHSGLVQVDEIHGQGGETLKELLRRHYEEGAMIVGVTATPIDLDGEWDELIVAGTVSEGRKCGALLPAYTFCPDVPDLKHVKKYRVGEVTDGQDLSDSDNAKIMMRPGVFGRVLTHWNRLNPEHKATILFAPDVKGSIYFAEQFQKAGIRAAHIDAKEIWLDGGFVPSDDENRHALLEMFKRDEIQVLSNRFVVREGIDLPHVYCGIFATVVGSLRSWIQMGGRILRSYPGMSHCLIIDHGGNFIRHGSLNSDRDWVLGQTGNKITGMRREDMRENPETEPIICPNCGMARLSGPTCLTCGHTCHKRSRLVVQIDGELKLKEGPTFQKRIRKLHHDTAEKWRDMYYRARSKKWNATFGQAENMFVLENHYYPPKDIAFMPYGRSDWFERVADVPKDRLL